MEAVTRRVKSLGVLARTPEIDMESQQKRLKKVLKRLKSPTRGLESAWEEAVQLLVDSLQGAASSFLPKDDIDIAAILIQHDTIHVLYILRLYQYHCRCIQ